MEILQARILEWVAVPSSRASSQPRDGNTQCLLHCVVAEGREVSWFSYVSLALMPEEQAQERGRDSGPGSPLRPLHVVLLGA